MTSILRRFWWGQANDKNKMAWHNWEKMCMPKKEGSLGFRYLKAFNLVMLAKQGWGLQTATDSLVYRVFKACYFPKGEFLSTKLGSHPSYTWRSIMAVQSLVQQGYRGHVGNGLSLNILKDKWLHKPTAFNVISKTMIVPLDARVSLLIDPYTLEISNDQRNIFNR